MSRRNYTMTADDRAAIVETAGRLGIDPHDLTQVMLFESAGTMDPDVRGGGTKNGVPRNYYGLIQFGPSERKQYGYRPGMTVAEQVRGPVYNFLHDRNLKPGSGVAQIYNKVNPGGGNFVPQIKGLASQARSTLAGHPVPPMNIGETAQGRQMPLGMGRGQIKTGPQVRQLQQQLADAGYKVNVDGQYGPQTAAAVRAFEQSSGLPVDRGVAGPQVQQRLAGNTATGDIMSARNIAPGGPGVVPDANPQDIAFGRPPRAQPFDVAQMGAPPPMGIGQAPGGPGTPFNVGAGTMPGAGGVSSPGYEPPGVGVPEQPLVARQDVNRFDTEQMASGRAPPQPVSPDPNQFGPDMAFLQRLSQPMDETLPAQVPGGPAEQPSPYQNRSFWALAGGLGQQPSSPPVPSANVGAIAAYDGSQRYPWAGDMPAAPSGGTSINDVIAGAQGIPGALGGAVMSGLGGASDWLNAQLSGGIPTSTASPLPPPAVSPGGSYADDHYGAGLSARPYPSGVPYSPPPQRQSSIGGFGGLDFMPGNAGADRFGPAGGEPTPLTPGGAGYTFLPGGIPQGQPGLQFDALPAYTPPDPVSLHGAPIDQAKQYAAAAQSSDRGGYGGGYSGPGGGGNYGSSGGNAPVSWARVNNITNYLTSNGVSPGNYVGATPPGYTAPNFSPGSGGSTYAYKPNGYGGGSFVDSHGNVHSY